MKSDLHIELWRAGVGVDTDDEDVGVYRCALDGVHIKEG